MIAQTLNRDFLLQVADLVRSELERELGGRRSPRRRAAPTELGELSDAELQEAAEQLRAVTHRIEPVDSESGEPGPAPKDDLAFIPRDALLSLIQTTIDEHAETSDDVEIEEDAEPGVRRRGGGEDVPAVTTRRIAGLDLVETAEGRRKWGDMEVTRNKLFSDPGWLTSGFAMGVRFFRGRAKWVDRPPIVQIADNARIIVVGDWGSGIPRANRVAGEIRQEINRSDGKELHVVHLGDVYYSGSKREYERNFLNLWPVEEDKDIGSFSLCGNHDMYYGGHAYYGTCLADPRFARQAGCSFFALKSNFWQLLALDTGYEDGGLHGEQATWARTLIDAAPDHRTALLSHHQLFSAHESGAKTLQAKIEPVLATGRVDAWFWGHEHRCIVYEASRWNGHRVGFASCVGHGGIPEYLVMRQGETKPKPWVYEYLKPFVTPGDEPWDTFGFAVIDLDDAQMSVRYIDEDGNEHYSVNEVVSPV